MQGFDYQRARSVAQAAAAATSTVAQAMLREPGSGSGEVLLKAGGIDLLDLMKQQLLQPAALLDLRAVPGLAGISGQPDGSLRIGAATTLAALAADPLAAARHPALCDAVGAGASPQIRNVATIGGNLLQRPRCWYFRSAAWHCVRKGGEHCFAMRGDNRYHAVFDNTGCAMVHPSTAATALVALDADVELADASGRSRRLALEDFLVGPQQSLQRENELRPQELLLALYLPRPGATSRMAYLRQGERESSDWPLAEAAVRLDFGADSTCTQASVVLGSVAPRPHRARAAQQALQGRRIDEALAARAARAALQGATPLADNAYKLPLIEALVQRAVLAAVDLPYRESPPGVRKGDLPGRL